MSRSYLKNIPTPLHWLVRPALFLSLGLHLLLLLLPLLPDRPSQQSQAEPEATAVALTPAPIEPPEPSPSAEASSVPAAVSTPLPPPALNLAPSPAVQAQPIVPSLSRPAAPAPIVSSPSPSSVSSPAPATPTPPQNQPQNRIVAPFANFPHLANAQPGCFNQTTGDCRQVSGNFRQVSQSLRDQLSNQGYEVKQRDDLEETGRQVYEVSQENTTRYLSVISSDLAGTAYILADEPVTQADIEQIGTVQTALQTLLGHLSGGNTATSAQFAYPEFFFTANQPRPEITGPAYRVSGTEPTQLADRLTTTLQTNGFQSSQIGEYGGGPVYEVGQKAFLGYVNLVPTQDGTGTIVVLWQSIPQ